jgi:hypothetical protein
MHRFEHARVQFRDIEQAVEEILHRLGRGRDLLDQPFPVRILLVLRQFCDEQAQRMHRLPQVVTGCRQES